MNHPPQNCKRCVLELLRRPLTLGLHFESSGAAARMLSRKRRRAGTGGPHEFRHSDALGYRPLVTDHRLQITPEGTGEGGIRTRGTSLTPYNGLANRRFQPLSHLSGKTSQPTTGVYPPTIPRSRPERNLFPVSRWGGAVVRFPCCQRGTKLRWASGARVTNRGGKGCF